MHAIPWKTVIIAALVVAVIFRVPQLRKTVAGVA